MEREPLGERSNCGDRAFRFGVFECKCNGRFFQSNGQLESLDDALKGNCILK